MCKSLKNYTCSAVATCYDIVVNIKNLNKKSCTEKSTFFALRESTNSPPTSKKKHFRVIIFLYKLHFYILIVLMTLLTYIS